MAAATAADRHYCRAILPKVSRTFALCIRLLPRGLEHPVAVAYLLCRIADTIEDAPALGAEEKERLLRELRDCLGSADAMPVALAAHFAAPAGDDERLARDAAVVLREFRRLPAEVQDEIRPRVQEMCEGMAGFARARGASVDGASVDGASELHALKTVDELNRYCYYVAGTVGHLLTGLFGIHAAVRATERHQRLVALATSFGLGLQLTNIVKDVTVDRGRGWSFVPRDLCERFGLAPEQLADPARRPEAHRVMQALVVMARRHLDDAVAYCTILPRRQYGIRLFCLLAVYLAVRTLDLADRDARLLEPGHKLKITRAAVYRTLAAAAVAAPSNRLVRGYYRHLAEPMGPLPALTLAADGVPAGPNA